MPSAPTAWGLPLLPVLMLVSAVAVLLACGAVAVLPGSAIAAALTLALVVASGVAAGTVVAARGSLSRLERTLAAADAGAKDGGAAAGPPASAVRAYSVLLDRAAISRRGKPPPQEDTRLYACGGGSVASLGVTVHSNALRWLLLRGSEAAKALYEDVAADRVRYLIIAGCTARVFAPPATAAAAASGGVALVLAHANARASDLTVRGACSASGGGGGGTNTNSEAVPLRVVPPTSRADSESSWTALSALLSSHGYGHGHGNGQDQPLPLQVWGYGGAS